MAGAAVSRAALAITAATATLLHDPPAVVQLAGVTVDVTSTLTTAAAAVDWSALLVALDEALQAKQCMRVCHWSLAVAVCTQNNGEADLGVPACE